MMMVRRVVARSNRCQLQKAAGSTPHSPPTPPLSFSSNHLAFSHNATPSSHPQGDQYALFTSSKGDILSSLKSTSEALKNHLCNCKNLKLQDARFVSENAPLFIQKLKASLESHVTGYGVQDSWICAAEDYLKKQGMNGLEPFLESIGMASFPHEEIEDICGIEELLEVVAVFEELGFARAGMGSLISRNRQLLSSSPVDIRQTIQFLGGFGLNRSELRLLMEQVPEIIRPKLKKQLAPFLRKLSELKVRKPVMQILLKNHAKFLALYPQWNFQECLDFLSGLGLPGSDINKILRKHPVVLIQSVKEKLIPKVEFLKNEGIQEQDIAHFLSCFPSFFSFDVEATLKPKLEYLSSLGLTRSHVASIVTRYPPILGCSIDQKMKPLVALLETWDITGRTLQKLIMGMPSIFGSSIDKTLEKIIRGLAGLEERPKSLSMALAWGCRKGKAAVKQKVNYLKNAGLSAEDVNRILIAEPFIVRVDLNVLKLKVEYFTRDMKFPIKELVNCPAYLSRHVMRKIKPRFKVLALLKSKHRLDNISLTDIAKISDRCFVEKFVKPYPDSQVIYNRFIAHSSRNRLSKQNVSCKGTNLRFPSISAKEDFMES